LLGSQPFVWVEVKQVLQKIQSFWRSRWEHIFQLSRLGWRQRLKHGLGYWTIYAFNIFLAWSASDLHDSVELIESRSSREHGLSEEELSENAAHGPHVCSFCVFV